MQKVIIGKKGQTKDTDPTVNTKARDHILYRNVSFQDLKNGKLESKLLAKSKFAIYFSFTAQYSQMTICPS